MKRLLAFAFLAAAAAPAAAQCVLEYQRADNSFAAPGRPDGNLGVEKLTLQPGEKKVFITDWKYEKQRNDGRNYYGSHMRIMRNTGERPVNVVLRGVANKNLPGGGGIITKVLGDRALGQLKPGQTADNLRADLMEVSCAAAGKEAKPAATPGGTPNAAAVQAPPTGLVARQASPYEVTLDWQKAPNAKEYRVYVSPPPSPALAGKPSVVGGSGTHFVIPIPRSNPPPGYRAAIEAVGHDGTVSPRVPFNAVQLQPTLSSGGSPGTSTSSTPSTPSVSGPAGQQCPAGQFVTGFTASGTLICAAPR